MRHAVKRIIASLLPAATLALVGCTALTAITDATRYYVLSPTAERHAASRTAASSASIGVGPIVIPGYLDRLPIVIRGANDEVEMSTYHRWAESLDTGMAQALADNLAAQIGSERIAVFPWRGGVARLLDYQVILVVLRFDGLPGHHVTLDTRWRLLGKEGRELALKRSTITERVTGEGYQTLVAAMNQAIAALAREIGAEIQSRADARAAGPS
jgi:uncharacterized lipoprotein YmbA